MNERQFARTVRDALDESAERLPYRVTLRLEAAREAALARMPSVATAASPVAAESLLPAIAAAGPSVGRSPGRPSEDTPPLWWRMVWSALPLLVIVAGLVGVSIWSDLQDANESAEVDAAMLVDDVPVTAYTDNGFGAFLRAQRP